MPPHLQLTLLNVPPALDAQAVLPRPQHVILNHVYCQRGQVRQRDASLHTKRKPRHNGVRVGAWIPRLHGYHAGASR